MKKITYTFEVDIKHGFGKTGLKRFKTLAAAQKYGKKLKEPYTIYQTHKEIQTVRIEMVKEPT